MSNKESFVKAFKELTGLDDDNGSANAAGADVSDESFERLIPRQDFMREPERDMRARTEPAASARRPEVRVPERSGEIVGTRITQGMNIVGAVTSADSIEVLGRIDGNIDINGDFVSEGTIVGDITANNVITRKSGVVKGDIKTGGTAIIEKDVTVVGSITAGNIKIDGKVKGNLFIEGNTELTENALVAGDIKTARISINNGSRIKGSIITEAANAEDDKDEFDIEV